jgi:hypothetical protein
MIVEDERDSYIDYAYDNNPAAITTPVEVSRNGQISFSEFLDNFHNMKDLENYLQLRKDLIKHLWDVKGRDGREE